MTYHEQNQEYLRDFERKLSPSLKMFTTMFQERLAKLEAQNDQAAIAVVFDQMDEILLLVASSATTRSQRHVPDDAILPVELRLVRTVWSVVNAEPLSRGLAQ